MKKIVIIGASSAIAESCANIWSNNKSVDLTLVGRDSLKLERIASDLSVRSPLSKFHVIQTEFKNPAGIQATVDTITKQSPIDIVLIAHGVLPDQNLCQTDLKMCQENLEINGISPVLFAEAFAMKMSKNNHGTIALISSVAGDRGRKTNYVYGAAKSLVSCYMQGLQNRFSGTSVKIILIKPGPTDTPMTAHLKNKGLKLASAKEVAQKIVFGIEKNSPTIYAPRKWQLIMWIIRNMPNKIFNKLNI